MRHELSSQAKSATATVLSVIAGGLQVAASAAHHGAAALRPPAGPVSTRPPATPPPGDGTRRTATVIGDLVHRPAREVLGEVDRLSADELRRLREHEQTGKQRKTVLDAVDKALRARQTG